VENKVIAVTYDVHDQMVLKSFNSICELAIRAVSEFMSQKLD